MNILLQATTFRDIMLRMSLVIVRIRPVATVLFVAVSTHVYLDGGLLSADTSILDPGG